MLIITFLCNCFNFQIQAYYIFITYFTNIHFHIKEIFHGESNIKFNSFYLGTKAQKVQFNLIFLVIIMSVIWLII